VYVHSRAKPKFETRQLNGKNCRRGNNHLEFLWLKDFRLEEYTDLIPTMPIVKEQRIIRVAIL
jgi:hypothetical protein